MKNQLTSIQKGRTKNFRYGTILCSLFFEKVPGLQPKVLLTISNPRDLWMGRCANLMKRLGSGDVPRMTFDDEFFAWWDQQVITVDDYLYARMDFRGDPNLVLPPDATWGTIGNNFLFFEFLKIFFGFLI